MFTLAPVTAHPDAHQPIRLTLDLRDVILNLILFAPLGAGLRLSGWRLSQLLACAVGFSTSIELLQWLLPIGREASLLDIAANSAGAVGAAWLVSQVSRALVASETGARWLAAAALLAWCVQVGMTAWALQRDIPVTPQYYGQWSHVFGDTQRLVGVVTAFTVQGRPVPDDSVPDTEMLRAALAQDTVTVDVAVTDLGPSVARSQVAAVTNGQGDLVTGVERHGCRIRFRFRLRGERLGLRAPSVLVATSCHPEPGVTTIAGRATPSSLGVTAAWDGEQRHATLALAPSLGWRLFAPRRWSGGAWDVLGSIGWLALWGAPFAFWLRAAWPRSLAAPALLYVVGLLGGAALVATASGLALGTPGDVVGVALGWWLGGVVARQESVRRQVNLA